MIGDGIYLTFTFTCIHCGDTVQVADGKQEPHPCPDAPTVVISGCHQWAADMHRQFGAGGTDG